MDATVSGGETGAIEGTLSIMVGADRGDFDEVKPILDAMGTTVVLVGPPGSGQSGQGGEPADRCRHYRTGGRGDCLSAVLRR